MKKRLFSALLAIMMCLAILPGHASAGYTTLSADAATSYYNLLNPIAQKRGIAVENYKKLFDNYYNYYYSGLVYAHLADFDGDGQPELYYVYCEGNLTFEFHQFLYTYRNGKLVNLGIPENFSAKHEITSLALLEGTDVAYVYYEDDYSTKNPAHTYYGVENGKLVTAFTWTYYSFTNSSPYYMINGKKTSIKEGVKAIQTFGNSLDTKAILFGRHAYSEDQTNYCKTYVNETLATLKAAKYPTSTVSTSNITLDGKTVTLGAYNISGNNYFKLRDLAALLDGTDKSFSVTWDNENKRINMVSGESYTKVGGELTALPTGSKDAMPTTASVYLDGQKLDLTVYNIGGNNYFKLRDLGQALNFGVGWDNSTKTVSISTDKGYTE